MNLRTMREYTEEVKKSSKLRHKIIFQLFKAHIKNCKDSGGIAGLPKIISK